MRIPTSGRQGAGAEADEGDASGPHDPEEHLHRATHWGNITGSVGRGEQGDHLMGAKLTSRKCPERFGKLGMSVQ